MGRVVNPGNVGFANMPTSKYVYKTGLIGEFDPTLSSNRRLVPSTRPRRFGKSHAALSLECLPQLRVRIQTALRRTRNLEAAGLLRPPQCIQRRSARYNRNHRRGETKRRRPNKRQETRYDPTRDRDRPWSCRLSRNGSWGSYARSFQTPMPAPVETMSYSPTQSSMWSMPRRKSSSS